jgi:hypothetical protein
MRLRLIDPSLYQPGSPAAHPRTRLGQHAHSPTRSVKSQSREGPPANGRSLANNIETGTGPGRPLVGDAELAGGVRPQPLGATLSERPSTASWRRSPTNAGEVTLDRHRPVPRIPGTRCSDAERFGPVHPFQGLASRGLERVHESG